LAQRRGRGRSGDERRRNSDRRRRAQHRGIEKGSDPADGPAQCGGRTGPRAQGQSSRRCRRSADIRRQSAKAKRPPKDLNEDVSYQFAQQQRQVDQEILQAKIALSHDTAEQAQLQLQMLDLATQARDAEIEHRVKKAQQDFAEGKITKATLDEVTAQAAILKEKGEQADRLKAQAILDERDSRLIQEQEAIDSHYLEIKQGLLQKQADLAQTQSERRAIELELLEIAYKEKRQALERLLESSKDAVTIANARNDLANLDANHALDKAGVIQQTRGPLEQWAAGMPDTAAKINEALQSIEVQGLDGLGQAITDVITGTKSLKDAFGELAKSIIADLIQMTIKMLIFRAVSSILGGSSSGLGNSAFPVVAGLTRWRLAPPAVRSAPGRCTWSVRRGPSCSARRRRE
jgi:hypothetical protein